MEESERKKKDEKLRIPVRGTNRKYYLTSPNLKQHRPHFYVRFAVPADIRRADPSLPKTVLRSTGTNLLKPAKLRAQHDIEDILAGRFQDAEQRKLRVMSSPFATIGEILDAYEPNARSVKPATKQRNKSALDLLLRQATGKTNVRDLSCDAVLTAKLWRGWIKARLDGVAHLDLIAQERAAITINSTLTMARSVLSPKVMECYADLKLPDLAELRAVRKLSVDADVSYRPLPNECLTRIRAAAQVLRRGEADVRAAGGRRLDAKEQRAVYLVYLLMSCLGLRNCEVFAARWCWIERRTEDGSARMVIERRPDFVAKNKKCRVLKISREVLAELDEARGLPDAWIIPAASRTERHHACYRWINSWLRPLMPPGREKGAYELRKHAASVILSRSPRDGGGIVGAAAFLGDTIAVTEKHYGAALREIEGISSAELVA